MDSDFDCVPGICKRKHKQKRYRDGHKFGRKYAMSTLSGDNNGNGPSKNLSSVRFGPDIGAGDRDDDGEDHTNYDAINFNDHTEPDAHNSSVNNRQNRGPHVHTTVRHNKRSRIERDMRNNAEAKSETTTTHVDFPNIAARKINNSIIDDIIEELVDDSIAYNSQPDNGKRPMVSQHDESTYSYTTNVSSSSDKYSVGFSTPIENDYGVNPLEGRKSSFRTGISISNSNNFPSGLRNKLSNSIENTIDNVKESVSRIKATKTRLGLNNSIMQIPNSNTNPAFQTPVSLRNSRLLADIDASSKELTNSMEKLRKNKEERLKRLAKQLGP